MFPGIVSRIFIPGELTYLKEKMQLMDTIVLQSEKTMAFGNFIIVEQIRYILFIVCLIAVIM